MACKISRSREIGSFELEERDINKQDKDLFEEYLTIVLYAICYAFYPTHRHFPRELIFRRVIFIPVPVSINKSREKTKSNPQEEVKGKFKTILLTI